MNTLETEQQQNQNQNQNQNSLFDFLDCEEKCWDFNHELDYDHDNGSGSSCLCDSSSSSSLNFCEDDEEQLNALFSKEGKTQLNVGDLGVDNNEFLMEARREGLEWMIRVNSHHNFSLITLLLGVNYFDRFMLSFGFQREIIPWMNHLAAVACLSLASKVEETHVPSLLDFQVEHKLIFEAKVIQKMELLVLSTLDWKMNAVTPLSYFGHLIKKLNLKTHFHWKILTRCETLILSSILDPRFLCYVPSVLAAATMVQTLKEVGLWSTLEHQNDIIVTSKLDKIKVEECYNFIQELSSNEKTHKRNYCNISSDDNVGDVLVSNESNNKDSSPEPLPKKCRTVGPPCFG